MNAKKYVLFLLYVILEQIKEYFRIVWKCKIGLLFVLAYTLVVYVYKKAPPIFSISSATYTHGILVISYLAWVFSYWAFVLTRKTYSFSVQGEEKTVKGNRNWVSVLFGIPPFFVFLLLGTPPLAMIIIGVLQLAAFTVGDQMQEQADYAFPRFCTLSLVALSLWMLVM
jgi:hypothetical protein